MTASDQRAEHSLRMEVRDLAQTISEDNDGLWLGEGPDDDLGHVARYIGRLEAEVDRLRRQAIVDAAHEDAINAYAGAMQKRDQLRRYEG
jgi:hypothetical protein